jgi:tRNA C32,U32 (ribose-2'-O)-methylase TrmJ
MYLVHNESLVEVFEALKDEVAEIVDDLSSAIYELDLVLDTDDEQEDKEEYTRKAIQLINKTIERLKK